MITAWVDAARRVGPIVAAHAAAGEQLRRLPAASVEALRDAGLLRLCVPAEYGGPEVDPLTLIEVIETVSTFDGAAGWCTMIACTTSSMSAFLPPSFAREIFEPAGNVAAGVFAPNGRAVADGDHWVVSGRWMWGSGTQHSQWIAGGVVTDDGTQHVMFFPAADVTFHDTWHTVGLRGTGSLEFSVEGGRVPAGRSVVPAEGRRYVAVPSAAFPSFTLLAIGVASVALGIARHAIDAFTELAVDKRPQFSQRTLAQTGTVQAEVARAEARVGAARAYLRHQVGESWQRVLDGRTVTLDDRLAMRLAGAHAAESAARAVDAVYTSAGGSAVFEDSPLQRCLRDVHVATQHIMVSPRMYETAGKHLLGQPVQDAMI